MATSIPLDMARGETATWDLTITGENGIIAPDISAATLLFQARLQPGDARPALTKTPGHGLAITDGPAGQLTLTVTAADTFALAAQGRTVVLTWALGVHTDLPHVPLVGTLTIAGDALDQAP